MRYPSVGVCIYCGESRYSQERKKLGDEHIIPLAANGDLILPDASCLKCERITQRPEEQLFSKSAKGFRTFYGYKSRRRPPKTLPLHNINNTGETKYIPTEFYPNSFALFFWPRPWLLSGKTINDSPMTNLWIDLEKKEQDKINLAKIGIHSWTGSSISNDSVFRTFAKIGHSYLTAEIGVGSFKPTLLDYIHKKNNNIHHLIGGTEQPEVPTNKPYQISWEKINIGDKSYAVVSVHLFAPQMAPTHLIVAGEF